MRDRGASWPGFAAVIAATSGGVAAGAVAPPEKRPPDAHDIRRPRGDVIEVHDHMRHATPRAVAYVAPVAGWRYSPVRVGDRLRPAFYGPRYVEAPPPGLPAARGTQRWVRYGDDLLLVESRDGRVLRIVADRFGSKGQWKKS